MRTKIFFLILFLLTIILMNKNIYGASSLTENLLLSPHYGYFNAYIVIPVRATEIERYSAEELRKYIKKITGGEISVISEQPNLDYFGFYIGRTAQGDRYKRPAISPYDGASGFRIKSIPNGLILVGADDLSTLFGVYAFLEEYQGCGWFMPNELGEVVPQRESISIPKELDDTQIPDIPIRWIGEDDWALKNRMNTQVQLNGHPVGVVNKWHYHTFDVLMPPEKYFKDHPEYFSMTDTSRIGSGRWQLCTSNPEVIKLVAHHLIDIFVKSPDVKYNSLTGNDWRGWCACSRCKTQLEPERINDQYGWVSNLIFTFDNEVAQRVKKYCPEQLVKVGAYFHGYQRYPLDPSYKPADNIAVQVCHLGFCHTHSITDPACPYNVEFMKDFRKWSDNSSHLYIYEYACLHGWIQLLWPMVHCLKEDMPEYQRSGAELFYTQAVGETFEAYALNYFVAAKLSWDASLDVDKLITEFCTKMYGPAGPLMDRYNKLIENSWANSGVHFSYAIEPVSIALPKLFPPEVMAQADLLLHEAESIEADSLSKKRIHLIRVDFDYLRLVLNYLGAISKPFYGIDMNNKEAMKKAADQAAARGKTLVPTIMKFLENNFPEKMWLNDWICSGIERILSTHLHPDQIPKNLVRE